MNPTGSFGAAIGGASPELQAAMSRRAGNPAAPTTAQVSNSAPTADPSTMTPQSPQGAPQAPMASATPQPTLPFDSSEATIILKAMDSRLKALSKMQGL